MLSPTDAAWSVLEEGHRVEKILPAALVGAAAYQGLRNAGFSLRDKEGNLSPGFRGSATVADPLGGVVASKEIEDPSDLERGTAVATQVLPVGAGIKAVRGIGRGAKTAVEGIRQADRAQAVARAADAEKAAQAALGISSSNSAWQALRKAWQAGDFSLSPDVVWLDDAALGGARGAHSEQGLIALNAAWATQASEQELEAVHGLAAGRRLPARVRPTESRSAAPSAGPTPRPRISSATGSRSSAERAAACDT